MVERQNKPSAIPVSPVVPTPQVSISDDNSRVIATLPSGGRIEVLLHGATILSWKSTDGSENLFLSDKALLDGSKPVRGGIPVVFPNFGPPNRQHATGKNSQHGFARTTRWEYLGKSSSESSSLPQSHGDASVKLDFGLSSSMLSEDDRAKWPYPFGITYSITLSNEQLETSFAVRNTGYEAWEFQVLFHSYLRVDDISKVAVQGLEDTGYVDKIINGRKYPSGGAIVFTGETDRVYAQALKQPVTVMEGGDGRYEITRDMLSDVVVWNPWEEKAQSIADFGPDDGYKSMVCVEAGSVNGWLNLEGGDTWEGGQRIRVL